MRRPVDVNAHFRFLLFVSLFRFSQAASVAILPSALFCERYALGASWVFSFQWCCYLIIDLCSHRFGESWAPGLSRSHLDSAVELGCRDRNSLGHFPHRFLAIAQWFVHLSAYPQPMQQYRQLSSHCHDRSLLGIFSSSLRKLASPSPQIAVFSKRSQNVVRSLHHHRPQIPVSFFADALLWFALPRVPAARSQPQKTAYLATLRKPIRVFDRQDIRQSDLCSHALHLLEQGHFRVHFLGDLLHPFIVFLDALVQRFDFFEQRLQNIPQFCAQCSGQLPAYLIRATLGQPLAIRLHEPPCGVHQGCSSTDQFRPRPDHRQVQLRFRTAMPHRPQQLGIDSRQSCQGPRIVPIIFSMALGDQLRLLCVRHDHFLSPLSEQPACPGGMCSCLQCHETPRYFSKGLLHRLRRRRQFLFQNDLACFIQNTVERPAISQIQPDRQLGLFENLVPVFRHSAILFHKPVSFVLRLERVNPWERIASRRRPAFSSHL